MRRTATLAALAAALLLAAACGGSEPAPTALPGESSTLPDELRGDLPPQDPQALEEIYGEAVADLGLRITDRGGLIDRRDGGYEPSSEGDHLALYLEPTGPRTPAQYLEGIRAVTAVFVDVLERWPGLRSFDVCQEPVPTPGGRDSQFPITQIDITRERAEAIDWDTVTAAELIEAAEDDTAGLVVRVSSVLRQDAAYEEMVGPQTTPG